MRESTTSEAIITIVDDDASLREGLQKRMAEVGRDISIVFLTGHGDIPASGQAIKVGAVEFLKPLDEQKLLAVRAGAIASRSLAIDR